jgi:hypothetical protein
MTSQIAVTRGNGEKMREMRDQTASHQVEDDCCPEHAYPSGLMRSQSVEELFTNPQWHEGLFVKSHRDQTCKPLKKLITSGRLGAWRLGLRVRFRAFPKLHRRFQNAK